MKNNLLNNQLLNDIKQIINESKRNLVRSVNNIMIETYWNIGKRIVEEEQSGLSRAKYANYVIRNLSRSLTNEYGKGFSLTNLKMMRRFYKEYRIGQTASDQSKKLQTVSGKLSWSHYLLLLGISDIHARSFYEHECINSNWSVRELDRQIDSGLYQRLLLSKNKVNKKQIIELSKNGITYNTPDSFIKDPMVMEFIGVNEHNSIMIESDLEKALIKHIEEFLLELGRGFMYVGSQQRISIGGLNYYVDMVFYNKILKSYVLIDLKIGTLKPENFGQMNMYVNYYKQFINNKSDSEPIGIILCADKDKKIAEISMKGLENNIYAAKYQYVMPDKEILENEVRKFMIDFKNK